MPVVRTVLALSVSGRSSINWGPNGEMLRRLTLALASIKNQSLTSSASAEACSSWLSVSARFPDRYLCQL
ncbi:hypothetical protein D3C81_1784110 [compost metagenome]